MSKAPSAFRTISEVSEELGVPKHVLRFWEMKFPQIKPMKRGGGRRYYRPEDLSLLKGICQLLHGEAFTIKGVQKILRERGVEAVKEMGDPDTASERALKEPRQETEALENASAPAGRKPTGKAKGKTRTAKQGATAEGPSEADIVSALNRAIEELQACRTALLANPPGGASKPKTRTRTGAAQAGR